GRSTSGWARFVVWRTKPQTADSSALSRPLSSDGHLLVSEQHSGADGSCSLLCPGSGIGFYGRSFDVGVLGEAKLLRRWVQRVDPQSAVPLVSAAKLSYVGRLLLACRGPRLAK